MTRPTPGIGLLPLLAGAALIACADPAAPPTYDMPVREGPPDLTGVTAGFRSAGGAAMIVLTDRPSDSARADLQALGVDPITDPDRDHFRWIYGGVPGDDATGAIAERPYVTGIRPLHDPPYGPALGPAPVRTDSAVETELELRASLDRLRVAPGDSVVLTVTLTNPADTAAVITYGHGCFHTLAATRALVVGTEVDMPLDGSRFGCEAVIWSDTLAAGAAEERTRTVIAAIHGIPAPAGTYRLRIRRNAIPMTPDLIVAFQVAFIP